jgi:3-hydroxymyristoyl/3-hydroxydecanoyl-(acyl carrier protein) dehydratase
VSAPAVNLVLHPEILNSGVDRHNLVLDLWVSQQLSVFAGHFPDFPLLPGVVQIDWAVRYARDYLGLDTPVIQVDRLKFSCPILPDTKVQLRISYNTEKAQADFSYTRSYARVHANHSELLFSQGRLLYAVDK